MDSEDELSKCTYYWCFNKVPVYFWLNFILKREQEIKMYLSCCCLHTRRVKYYKCMWPCCDCKRATKQHESVLSKTRLRKARSLRIKCVSLKISWLIFYAVFQVEMKNFACVPTWACSHANWINDVKRLKTTEPLIEKTFGRGSVTFGEQKNKQRNGETSLRTEIYFEWIIKQLMNSAFVGYEEFCRSWRVLSTLAFSLGGYYPPRSAEFLYPVQRHLIVAKHGIA